MNDKEKIQLVSAFEYAVLNLERAKYGRDKVATKKHEQALKKLLTAVLGRKPTDADLEDYSNS